MWSGINRILGAGIKVLTKTRFLPSRSLHSTAEKDMQIKTVRFYEEK